jgi:hypothetical protein
MFKLSRISSVGGMSAALAAPIGALALGHTNMVPVLAALARWCCISIVKISPACAPEPNRKWARKRDERPCTGLVAR